MPTTAFADDEIIISVTREVIHCAWKSKFFRFWAVCPGN